ncbi:nucleoside 2-deoxyribosyltransferase [Agrobacterium larrymoorei]|uniref:Nucleoside 2-deoxyribosyltransferase n=1 Tax=Agrobacterium larrymoorei TaxID=160699 RepID=A0A4D7E4Q3_9HYPH|nr:nucleoside 2-deoxyribosyltransferase [Agrobacterium larrymoorei]QCJ00021.1 nucleoside 2-deoxyribosyltransferase [Agrobacterium larrymoorei]QYA09536.1 nucleoside 2-deoxyribosyltransferase [Agrobacterium larrymoorei]
MTKKIYLAGPEVFLPNAREMLDAKALLAREAGFIPLSPGDLQIPPADTKVGHGCNINAIDEQMMLEADAVIANLTPFRGIAADTGTSYELGFMCALGKPVFAYTNIAANHFSRIRDHYVGAVTLGEDGRYRGPDGLSVENFDMVDNLMLHGGILRRGGSVVVGDAQPQDLYTVLTAFRECLVLAAAKLL